MLNRQDWFARFVYAVSEMVKRPSLPDAVPSVEHAAEGEPAEDVVDWAAPVSSDGLRLPVTVMLVAGVMLVWMGQAAYASVPPLAQRSVIFLMGVGGLTFLWAGNIARQQWVPRWLVPRVLAFRIVSMKASQRVMIPASAECSSISMVRKGLPSVSLLKNFAK